MTNKVDILKAGAHAPSGGVVIEGQKFRGGQFIPGEMMKRASAAQRREILSGKKAKTTAKPSEKVQRAQASAVRVDKTIQQYAEEYNEPKFAKKIGGMSFRDNEPVDVVLSDDNGRVAHGIELKTMVVNGNNKITMKREAIARKKKWMRANKAEFHTIVIDDTKVFNAKGDGVHDESKRRYFYRRGVGSFRVGTMHEVKNVAELKKLIYTSKRQLPAAAKS